MTVEFLSHYEVLQVLVVYPDLYQVLGSFQEMPPLFQYADDSEHLFVMDLVVPFHLSQTSFGHISTNSLTILTVSMAMESP